MAKHFGESFSDVVESRLADNLGLVLIRPDGYVAYSSEKNDMAALEAMRSVPYRQVKSPIIGEEAA